MPLCVLDTDCVTLLLRGHAGISERAASHDPAELAISIVTVEELMAGWYSQIRKAKKDDQLIRAYGALQEAVEFSARVRILPLNQQAMLVFRDLTSRKLRLGTNDLRIAAIAISSNAVLVTRNRQDFRRITNLQIEDWS